MWGLWVLLVIGHIWFELDERKKEQKYGKRPKTKIINYNDINVLTEIQFENRLAQVFRELGYQVQLTPPSGDQGADLIITKGPERIAVQAKRKNTAVTNRAIQEVVAAVSFYGCHSAMVVTNSTFTRSALELAKYNSVILWGGEELKRRIAYINNRRSHTPELATRQDSHQMPKRYRDLW